MYVIKILTSELSALFFIHNFNEIISMPTRHMALNHMAMPFLRMYNIIVLQNKGYFSREPISNSIYVSCGCFPQVLFSNGQLLCFTIHFCLSYFKV